MQAFVCRFELMGWRIGDPPALPPGLGLSRLQVLRSLRLGDWTWEYGLTDRSRHTLVVEMFSAIRSPMFSELVLDVGDHELSCFPVDVGLFGALRKASAIRPFKLAFLLDVQNRYPTEVRRRFTEALHSVTEKGLLDFLDSPPTITYTRRVRPRHDCEWDVSFPEFD